MPTVHLCNHSTHITLDEPVGATFGQLKAGVAEALVATGLAGAEDVASLRLALPNGEEWQEQPDEAIFDFATPQVAYGFATGRATGGATEFGFTPVADID